MSTKRAMSPKLWSREIPVRNGPIRSSGGLYRSAKQHSGSAGGVPLDTANAAVVAAVRLAYKVAEEQIDRSTRLAKRLRDAADSQVGPGSDRKAVDAAERLVWKALMSGLEWWEGSVAEGRCPVKRLAAAEYQMLGTVLGLGASQAAGSAQSAPKPGSARTDDRDRNAAATASRRQAAARKLLIAYTGAPERRRPVAPEKWEISRIDALQTVVWFFSVANMGSTPFKAQLVLDGAGADACLSLDPPPDVPGGRWRCAICDEAGVQLGFIDITLT